MKAKGNFKFKSLTKREGGEFVDANGTSRKYDPSYSLKVDDISSGDIYERVFKVAVNSPLVAQLQTLKPYENITIEFDVQFYGANARFVPVSITK